MLLKAAFLSALLNVAVAQADSGSDSTQIVTIDNPPNTMAQSHWNERTAAVNATWMVIPVNKTAVVDAVWPYKLLDVLPRSIFPEGFPNGTHPVIARIGYANNISQSHHSIGKKMVGSLFVPFVDKTDDKYNPFNFVLKNWLGGVESEWDGVIPAVFSNIGGKESWPANFSSNGTAYDAVGNGRYEAKVQDIDIPYVTNPFDKNGFGLVDMSFTTDLEPTLTNHTFHHMLNQPEILGLLRIKSCFRNTIYFNETFSQPTFRIGNVTLFENLGLKGFSGLYQNVSGFSATGQEIAYSDEKCKQAQKSVDPEAMA